MKTWGLRLLFATVLLGIGYKTPTVWLWISAGIWGAYVVSYLTFPLLIAASQNTVIAKTARQIIAVLQTLAIAALISAPVIMALWYLTTSNSTVTHVG